MSTKKKSKKIQVKPPQPSLIARLEDLHAQATTERSHYYVASCIREAIQEILVLRQKLATKTRVEKELGVLSKMLK